MWWARVSEISEGDCLAVLLVLVLLAGPCHTAAAAAAAATSILGVLLRCVVK
jgi:hypothetical protein